MLMYPQLQERGGRLLSPEGRVPWCGPFAVAVLTGWDYDKAYEACRADLKAISRAREMVRLDSEYTAAYSINVTDPTIEGQMAHQVQRVLFKAGVFFEWDQDRRFRTVLEFTRAQPEGTFLLAVGTEKTSHWIVIHDGMMYHSHHLPCPVSEAPRYKRSPVLNWADLTRP